MTADRGDDLEGLAFSGWQSEMIGDGDAAYYSGSTTGRGHDNDASCSPVQAPERRQKMPGGERRVVGRDVRGDEGARHGGGTRRRRGRGTW